MTRFKGREGVKGHLFHLDFTNNKILHVMHVMQRDNKHLLSDFVSGAFIHFILTTILWRRNYCLYFTNKETQFAQGHKAGKW